jgi:exopolysaccharide production protein ExoZ
VTNHAPMPRGRLYGIQGLRGLAVLMVASVHLYEVERKFSHGPLLFGSWIHGSVMGLDLFLVISGFMITLLAFGHFADPAYLRSYAYNRVTRVYPVYLLYTLPLVPVFLAAPQLFNASEGHQVSLWRSLLLIPDTALPLIPVAWTLHHELYFYLVFGLMLCLPERRLPWGILAWTAVCAAAVLADWGVPREDKGAFQRVFSNPLNFDFILGMVVAWLIRNGARRNGLSCLLGGTTCWLALFSLHFALTGQSRPDDNWALLVFGVPAALITYGVAALELQRGWAFARPLAWVGDAAYTLYLTHVLTMVVVGRLWSRFGTDGWAPHLLFLVAATAAVLGVGHWGYEWIEKRLTRQLRQFDPMRVRPVPA